MKPITHYSICLYKALQQETGQVGAIYVSVCTLSTQPFPFTVINHDNYNFFKCDWCRHKVLYFALINLQSCNRTVGCNRPFAGSSHVVRNKLHPDANNAVGLPKQRNSYQSSPTFLSFESPTTSFASQHN